MLNSKLYFTILFLMCLSASFTTDFYSKFHQRDYKSEFQRTELIYYDKSVFNFIDVKTFKYNRTLPVMNMTMNSKVNIIATEMEVAVQFYKLLSNQYRKLYGSNFQVNFCKSIDENLVGLQAVYKCGNFTSCQILKGTTYKICNFYPDGSRFPPFIPTGEYKFLLEVLYGDKSVIIVHVFVKISRPELLE